MSKHKFTLSLSLWIINTIMIQIKICIDLLHPMHRLRQRGCLKQHAGLRFSNTCSFKIWCFGISLRWICQFETFAGKENSRRVTNKFEIKNKICKKEKEYINSFFSSQSGPDLWKHNTNVNAEMRKNDQKRYSRQKLK